MEEGFAGVAFEPGVVAAAGQLVVLELRDMGQEAVSDHRAGMRVVVAVDHEDRAWNNTEGGGIDASVLLVEHIIPGLVEGAGAALDGTGVTIMFICIDGQDGTAEMGQAEIGVGLFGLDPLDFGLDGRGCAVGNHQVHAGPGAFIETAAGNQGQGTGRPGMGGSKGQGQHGAPGMADEDGRLRTMLLDKIGQIGNMSGHGDGLVTIIRALNGLVDATVTGQGFGDGAEITPDAGAAVEQDDIWCRL